MRIVIDAMGGDNAPGEIIKGAVEAADTVAAQIVLVGNRKVIEKELSNYDKKKNISIVNASQVILNEDKPTKAIKEKKDSSMVVGLHMIRDEEADVFISAGNTGALLTGALLEVGRIKGVSRPALAPFIPTVKNTQFLLLDSGANTNCKPQYLAQFAHMGSIYMEKTTGILNPKIGLINIGVEPEKGNELVKSTYELLSRAQLNFAGNIECRNLMNGDIDVAVCDGFTGNIILKTIEGTGMSLFSMLKEQMEKNIKNKMGALLLKDSFKDIKHKMDYGDNGGALFLGIDGGIIKCHGSSNDKTIKSAVKQAFGFVKNGTIETIRERI